MVPFEAVHRLPTAFSESLSYFMLHQVLEFAEPNTQNVPVPWRAHHSMCSAQDSVRLSPLLSLDRLQLDLHEL